MLMHHGHGLWILIAIGGMIAVGLIGLILILKNLMQQLIKINLELEDE